MGKTFIAVRSGISCHVLCVPEPGPAVALEHAWTTPEGEPCPLLWGPDAEDCLHLAQVMYSACLGRAADVYRGNLEPLVQRLRAQTSDRWIMTEAEVLDGLHLTS